MEKKKLSLNGFFWFAFPFAFVEILFLWYVTATNHILDFSHLIIGFVSFYFYLKNVDKTNNITLKVNKRIIFFNLFLLLSYFGIITIVYHDLNLMTSLPIRMALMFLALSVIFTSLISFLDINLFKRNKLASFVLLPLSFIVITYPTLNSALWTFLSSSTCKLVIGAFSLLGYKNVSLVGDYTLKSPGFSISIHSACSGLEGITFLIAIFSFYLIVFFDKSLKPDYIFLSYSLGVLYMYLLNVVRISIYFIFGFSMVNKYGSEKATESIIELFHSNVGWVIYFVGISLFVYFWNSISKKLKVII